MTLTRDSLAVVSGTTNDVKRSLTRGCGLVDYHTKFKMDSYAVLMITHQITRGGQKEKRNGGFSWRSVLHFDIHDTQSHDSLILLISARAMPHKTKNIIPSLQA